MSNQEVQVKLSLPLLTLSGNWAVQNVEKDAAWELYVELVTRISTVPLGGEDSGLLREALSSLYSIFAATRDILKRYGRTVAKRRKGSLSFGAIAVAVLNSGIRPFLAKWHPALEDYEATREEGVSRFEHERSWERSQKMREELEELRSALVQYTRLLEETLSMDDSASLL